MLGIFYWNNVYNQQIIESKDNAQVKRVVKLLKESKFRNQEQQSVVYGEHLIIEAGRKKLLKQVWVLKESYEKYYSLLSDCQCDIMVIPSAIMSKLNILDSIVDILGVINFVASTKFDNNADCLVLEHIQDPGNLGTILRAASASGIKQVVLSNNSVDIYNPKVLRASQGIQFNLVIFTNADISNILTNYQGQILAFTPHTENSLYEYDLTKPSAFIFGNEGQGLSDNILEQFTQQVKIPMLGNAESINLAMAATVAVFEMSRQRIYKKNERK